jgi:hypothetical protein
MVRKDPNAPIEEGELLLLVVLWEAAYAAAFPEYKIHNGIH